MDALRRSRNLGKNFLKVYGSDPEKIADTIIKSIKKDKGLVSLGFATHLMYTLRKFFPRFLDRLNASIYRNMVKKKYLQ